MANGSEVNSFFEDGDGSGPAGIIRYTNFGGGTTGYGLVTEFDSASASPEPGTLICSGVHWPVSSSGAGRA